jgi:hypothetical protein
LLDDCHLPTPSGREIIENFPNSLEFRDLYIPYLIEATTHYADSVFQKWRAEK